ncbi:hypothetical protein FCE95_06675 [Luteimonas gilva]|uniref:Uncharacterized protein n=1 Tax=Luteimonas gilva TaxID=2572684 RepID=A0A4U5K4F9_9GAMM|nr:hypothetical protein [Luteimonas gilva]TKR33949.1 hypothetical protein FCE95_06675 [Luteimonas gilva]
MSQAPGPPPHADSDARVRIEPQRRWDAFGMIVASCIGLLALLVSGYTAYVQRQQVRAQVWPHATIAYQDQDRRVSIFNKGVGPAKLETVRITVDGKPYRNWAAVLSALGLSGAEYGHSTLSETVLSPGESLAVLIFKDPSIYARFRRGMNARGRMDFCYCSTLEECWVFEDRRAPVKPVVRPVAQCPWQTATEAFTD